MHALPSPNTTFTKGKYTTSWELHRYKLDSTGLMRYWLVPKSDFNTRFTLNDTKIPSDYLESRWPETPRKIVEILKNDIDIVRSVPTNQLLGMNKEDIARLKDVSAILTRLDEKDVEAIFNLKLKEIAGRWEYGSLLKRF